MLAAARNLKMARSAHAYVRGNTAKFYEWLAADKQLVIPDGPSVWICGDCHVGNLGPLASAKGQIDIQIRDLDQTVIGNPAYDLIRLGLSLASAARGSDLPGVTTSRMLEQLVEGYELAFSDDIGDQEAVRPQAVDATLKAALKRKWKHLAAERIKGTTPTIPIGRTFLAISKPEREAINALFRDEKIRRLVTSLRFRDDDAQIEVLDAAYWVKGCSSLGLLRYAVLLGVGGKDGETCLVDIKEGIKAVAPTAEKADMPKDNAERVVQGAWHLSPALGERMRASTLLGKSVFLRELLPQDLKFEIEHLTPDEAMKVSKFLALIVGKAHARQMSDDDRKSWKKILNHNRPKTLNAPNWLWSGVVELLAEHEKAYLEHCRKYALALDGVPG
ncbi:DUF2252 family protein [Asticcacaulis solisilvae]|uniref:DUF2252 family protein n=1 Tax=Asticcacaulis solisilvae TaxID=1217274 RepID=UPI003FD770C3